MFIAESLIQLNQKVHQIYLLFSMRSNPTLLQFGPHHQIVFALVIFLSCMNAFALSCVSPDDIVQSALHRRGPAFHAAEMVFYGKVVELLPDRRPGQGVSQVEGGSRVARVRVIEGFRGPTAGQELTLHAETDIAGASGFFASDSGLLIVVERGLVPPCLQLHISLDQLVMLRRHFKRYPDTAVPAKNLR